MLLGNVFGIKNVGSSFSFDFKGAAVLAVVAMIPIVYSKITKKKFSPILLILISGGLGVLLWGL
jgi:hypothetical protein